MIMTKIFLTAIFAYCLGSLPTGYLITKLWIKKDIRELGSKNTGATNVYRNVGKLPALLTLIVDILKGFFSVKLAIFLFPNLDFFHVVIGVLAILGHSYSVFLKFKGGKSVATMIGVFLALATPAMFISIILFFCILGLFGYVSLSSILASIFLPILIKFLGYNYYIFFASVLASIFVIYRHRENIKRLINGTENKIIK